MELLTGDIKKIYRKFLFTALGSTIISSIYASVDLIAVGHYCGPNGSAAISCINPLWSIMISLGIFFGIGGSVLMSSQRGAGNKGSGDEFYTVAMICGLAAAAAIFAVFVFLAEPMLRFFGADDEILPYAMDYFRWIAYVSPTFLLTSLLNSFIRNDGTPGLCTIATVSGGVLNIIGDYVLVFVADLGASGAGIATAIGQLVGFVILCTYFFRKRCTLRLVRVQEFGKKLWGVVSTGFAPFIVDLAFGVVVIICNRQIVRWAGNTELGIYGTVANVAILFQGLFYAVGQAVQPVVSTNFGGERADRVRASLRICMGTTLGMSLVFFALCEAFPLPILKLFMAVTPQVVAAGPRIMRIYAVSFLFMGVNVVATYYLQSILRSAQSVVISLLRGFALCSAFLMILPPVAGFSSIWWTFALTEVITLGYTIFSLKRANRALPGGNV